MSTPLPVLGNRTPEQLKVAELREELRKRGIQIKGLKKDLIDRLEEVLKQEELEQRKGLAAVLDDASTASMPANQSDVTPATKKRSKGYDYHNTEEAKHIMIHEPDNAVVVFAETEEATVVSAPQEGDILSHCVAGSLLEGFEAVPQNIAGGTKETAGIQIGAKTMGILSASAEEDLSTNGPSRVDNEKTIIVSPALEDLVADLERLEDPNFKLVLQEEAQGQQVEAEGTRMIGGEMFSGKSTDTVRTVEKGVDKVMGGMEKVPTTTFEKTVTTLGTLVVPVVSDQIDVIVQEDQFVSTSTRVSTTEEQVNEDVTKENTITTVDGEGVQLHMEAVRLSDESGYALGEASKEYVTKVVNYVSITGTPNSQTLMDVDADIERESHLESPKGERPTAVDGGNENEMTLDKLTEEMATNINADTQKGSKRKDTDGEQIILELTKRRRWNSAKGEGDSRGLGKDFQPLELQEPRPSLHVPVLSAKVQTPKSALVEKVAITRTAAARTEASVNGEGQKTRVVPPSTKPATTSLKIDKFLRPFTFKAVKELLAQTGTVQDVWMDQIKTHCYVTYSSVEDATATRNALFNLQWPPQGGRLLTAEYVDPSEVKLRSDGEKAAGAVGSTATAAPSMNAVLPRGSNATQSKASKDGSTVLSSSQSSISAATTVPPPLLPFPPRDRSKQELERTPTLDDLFRKTRSKPHIYYLPLTAAEAAGKLAARNREVPAKHGVKV